MIESKFGTGSMVYTVIYHQHNGDISYMVATGPHDKSRALQRASLKFERLIALVPGNHTPIFQPHIS
jgi:hypothetical protein